MNKMKIALMKFLVRTVGMTSTGIQMSFRYGFTSGKMLDYIYRNRPSGKYGIGWLIDKIYLSHKGWEAIRTRKKNLEASLEKALRDVLSRNGAACLLDIASGPAQYIVDTLRRVNNPAIETLCRDYDERWVREGQQKAEDSRIPNIRFERGDAFDRESFLSLLGTQDVVVSSGFYDWITDDARVKKSMSIVNEILKPGGYFIFTNQSGHFDLAMMQELFVDFNNQPLTMTTRSSQMMNGWAQEAGFVIVESVSDAWGYYTVSVTRKPS